MGLMGVDVGSSRCKAVVFSESGTVLSEAAEEYTPEFPGPARVEMDPEVLWRAVASAIRRSAAATNEPVEAVGLSSHGESFVPVGADGSPLSLAIMNADNRAAEDARWWEEQIGRRRTFETTGMIVHPMYPAVKLRWLRRNEPELFAAAARFVGVSEYVLLKLGFEPLVAYSLACRFMAFDVRKLDWSAEMLQAAGISANRLPIPVQSGTVAGRLSRMMAAEIGLSEGTPVVLGGHDQPCGALGMGAIAPGMVTNSLGSFECLVAVGNEPTLDENALAASLNSYCHAVPNEYITIAYFPAGLMVKWFVDGFCGEESRAAGERGIGLFEYLDQAAPEGPTGLCVLPHLIGSSNPHFDPQATGAVVGLTQRTRRIDLYKGILEGLACELAIIADLLGSAVGRFDTIRCTGGGARSQLGLQLRATMTGRSMQTLTCPEAVCLGVALLAGVSAGTYNNVTEAVEQVVRVTDTVGSDPASAAAYSMQVERYRLLYPALEPLRKRQSI